MLSKPDRFGVKFFIPTHANAKWSYLVGFVMKLKRNLFVTTHNDGSVDRKLQLLLFNFHEFVALRMYRE